MIAFDQHGLHVENQYNIVNQAAPEPLALNLHQLPPPPGDFTGRRAELAAWQANLNDGAIVSGVRGMGGVGKTALALKFADLIKDQYPDAQFYINLLGTSSTPLTVVDALAHVIRAYYPTSQLPDTEAGLRGLYQTVLYGKRVLIVLDDARDGAQVTPLLPPASCALLFTSRYHFQVAGLRAIDVHELHPVDAQGLILKVAPRIGAHADTIAQLCGFLPLALRAASSLIEATPDLSPLTYIERLRDEKTRLAHIGAEGVDISIKASINLSYNYLAPKSASVFCCLAVFPTSFYAGSEEIVCEDADHTHLSILTRLSLVQFDSIRKRYRLHDRVRIFARTLIFEKDFEGAQHRHSQHFGIVSIYLNGSFYQGQDQMLRALAVFDTEWLNIKAGQAWAGENRAQSIDTARLCAHYAINEILSLRLHPREYIQWLEAAFEVAEIANDMKQKETLLGHLGNAYADIGETLNAIRVTGKALEIAVRIGDKRGECTWLNNLGNRHLDMGQRVEATRYYESALSLARELNSKRQEAMVLSNLGKVYIQSGQNQKAIESFTEVLRFNREIGNLRGEGNTLNDLGLAYFNLNDLAKAMEYYKASLAIRQAIGDHHGEGQTLTNLGGVYYKLGDIPKSIEFYEMRSRLAYQLEDQRGISAALARLGLAYAALGRLAEAIDYYRQALNLMRVTLDRPHEIATLVNLSVALEKAGKRAEAIASAEDALKLCEEIESPYEDTVRQGLKRLRMMII